MTRPGNIACFRLRQTLSEVRPMSKLGRGESQKRSLFFLVLPLVLSGEKSVRHPTRRLRWLVSAQPLSRHSKCHLLASACVQVAICTITAGLGFASNSVLSRFQSSGFRAMSCGDVRGTREEQLKLRILHTPWVLVRPCKQSMVQEKSAPSDLRSAWLRAGTCFRKPQHAPLSPKSFVH